MWKVTIPYNPRHWNIIKDIVSSDQNIKNIKKWEKKASEIKILLLEQLQNKNFSVALRDTIKQIIEDCSHDQDLLKLFNYSM